MRSSKCEIVIDYRVYTAYVHTCTYSPLITYIILQNLWQLHTLTERYVECGCTLNCLCYPPYLVSLLFVELLSLHLVTLVYFPFFSSMCMLELKFAIHHIAVSLSS